MSWSFHERIFHFLTEPLRKAYPGVKFITTGPSEALILYMKMAFFVGIFLAAPYLLYQLWAFVAPGLYAHEKNYAIPFIVMGSLFFLGGAAFGHYVLFPTTFGFLIGFGGEDMQFLPKVDEYYSFYSWFLLGLGLVFQLPVIIFVLARIGLVTPRVPDPPLQVRGAGVVHPRRGDHPHARRHGADDARRADARAVRAGDRGGVGVRPAAARGRGQRLGSVKPRAAPTTIFSRAAAPAFISTT